MRLPGFLTRHTAFVGNVAAMMSGKTISAGIALFTMPVIARLFSPSDFGIAAVFLSLSGLFANVGSLRYEVALVLPRQHEEAVLIMAICYRVLAAFCAALLVLIVVYSLSGLEIAVLESMGVWLWLLPLGLLLTSAISIQEYWLARRESFKLVAASMVVGTSITGGSRIGFGLIGGSSVFGLIVGNLIGMACRLGVQRVASAEGLRASMLKVPWSEQKTIARRYADFPKLNAPAAFLFSSAQNLPVLMFGILFSPAVTGFYAMTMRLSQVPIAIVANSVRRVFLQKAAAIQKSGRSLRPAFLLSTFALALLGVVPFGALWLFGQPLVTWLLGERWFEAGRFVEIVAPWLFMVWVTAPSNPIFVVLRKQKVWLSLQAVTTIVRLGAFGLAYVLAAGPAWTLTAFVIATVIGNVGIVLMALWLIAQHAAPIRGAVQPICEEDPQP